MRSYLPTIPDFTTCTTSPATTGNVPENEISQIINTVSAKKLRLKVKVATNGAITTNILNASHIIIVEC